MPAAMFLASAEADEAFKAYCEKLMREAEKCELCGHPRHFIGRCPVIVARERNEVLEEAAKVADRWVALSTGPRREGSAIIAAGIRGLKDLEAARGINQLAGIAKGSEVGDHNQDGPLSS